MNAFLKDLRRAAKAVNALRPVLRYPGTPISVPLDSYWRPEVVLEVGVVGHNSAAQALCTELRRVRGAKHESHGAKDSMGADTVIERVEVVVDGVVFKAQFSRLPAEDAP